jgi:hypothetical protein
VLLCAPSMGILDNWLPVLHVVRAEHPEWRIVALIPDRDTLAQLDPADTAHVLADELIDVTVVPLVDGGWVRTSGLLEATAAAAPGPSARLLLSAADMLARLASRTPLSQRETAHPLRGMLRLLRTRRQRDSLASIEDLNSSSHRLLFDLDLHGKARLRPLLERLGHVRRHAMLHGIMLIEEDPRATPSPDPDLEAAAYLFGACELAPYTNNFGIPRERLHVVGVARHEQDWVRRVVSRSRDLHPIPFDRAVFVVSRPARSSYLPPDRKVALLRALHRIAWEEHGLPLVLRTHPKEVEDGTIAAALPSGTEGRSWAISAAHPFHLAQHAEVAITFYSGIAVDLVALGVPVIQLLDVRGLTGHDGPDTARDPRGRPRFGAYARDGFVHCADDADDLSGLFVRLADDRAALLAPLQQRYDELIAPPSGAARTIVSTLADDLGRASGRPN